MTTTTTRATYTHDEGSSNCGAHRPQVDYTEYVRYDLTLPLDGEEVESSASSNSALAAYG